MPIDKTYASAAVSLGALGVGVMSKNPVVVSASLATAWTSAAVHSYFDKDQRWTTVPYAIGAISSVMVLRYPNAAFAMMFVPFAATTYGITTTLYAIYKNAKTRSD